MFKNSSRKCPRQVGHCSVAFLTNGFPLCPRRNEGITPSIPAGFRHKPETRASAPAESRTKAQAVTAAKMKASPSISEAVLNDESLHESPQASPKNVRPDPPTTSKHKQDATILARLPLSAREPTIAGRRAQRHSQHQPLQ